MRYSSIRVEINFTTTTTTTTTATAAATATATTTTNFGLRLTVSRYPSAHIWDLDLRVAMVACDGHICHHSSTYFYFR